MTPWVWSEITAANEDMTRLVSSAFADGRKLPDLDQLRARLRRRLDELLAALSPLITEEAAVSILVPLVFLVDEQVEIRLARLDPPAAERWLLLQRDLFPDGDGGDVFFEQAAALLRQPSPSPLLVGVYLFCLEAGFQGRLVDDPAAIPQWKTRLAGRLAAAGSQQAAPGASSFRRARPWSQYALGAAGAVVAFQIVLLAIARAM